MILSGRVGVVPGGVPQTDPSIGDTDTEAPRERYRAAFGSTNYAVVLGGVELVVVDSPSPYDHIRTNNPSIRLFQAIDSPSLTSWHAGVATPPSTRRQEASHPKLHDFSYVHHYSVRHHCVHSRNATMSFLRGCSP